MVVHHENAECARHIDPHSCSMMRAVGRRLDLQPRRQTGDARFATASCNGASLKERHLEGLSMAQHLVSVCFYRVSAPGAPVISPRDCAGISEAARACCTPMRAPRVQTNSA